MLTLSSERFEEREANRRDILEILSALVEQGKKLDAGEVQAVTEKRAS